MKRVRCHGTGDSVAGGGLVGQGEGGGGGGGSPGPLLGADVGLLVQLVHLVQVGWTQETGSSTTDLISQAGPTTKSNTFIFKLSMRFYPKQLTLSTFVQRK